MKQATQIGVDVSAKELVCAMKHNGQSYPLARFSNDAKGHRQFIRWATRHGKAIRVCLEATGVYSLDFALALQRNNTIEVMVANPRAIKDFARAFMQRAKTDGVDAQVILEFLERMPFQPWQPPGAALLKLQAITRRIVQLKGLLTQERNRLHASSYNRATDIIANDIEVTIRHLEKRIKQLEQSGLAVVKEDPELSTKLDRLVSVKGIAEASAMRLLAELLVLPEDLTAPQWVAHAGLDPRPYESGTSVNKPRRITKVGNRYLRAALYMPALVAIQREPHITAFYDKLIAAGKKPMQAVVAVMRKLLHAIWGMLKHNQNFDGTKFYKLA